MIDSHLRVSIRTLLAITFSIAAMVSLVVVEPNGYTFLWAYPTYIACWLVPSASIGYDYHGSRDGIWAGVIRGGILCVLSFLILVMFLPAVQ